MWLDHIDPDRRDDALRIEDDDARLPVVDAGATRSCVPVDVQYPGQTSELGDRRERIRAGLPAEASYDEQLPRDYWDAARARRPTHRDGRRRGDGVPELRAHSGNARSMPISASLTANMTAWNRWCASVAADGARTRAPGRARDAARRRVAAHGARRLARDGVHLAMIAPALVDGRPLSHPDHDPIWRAFVEHGVTPVFHVADQRRPFDDAWYTQPEDFGCRRSSRCSSGPRPRSRAPTSSSTARSNASRPAHRHRRAQRDLGADVPDDARRRLRLHGQAQRPSARRARASGRASTSAGRCACRRSRTSCPARLIRQTGDLYMCCSDYPHSEGTSTPLADYTRQRASRSGPTTRPGFFHDNVALLLEPR